MASLRVHCFPPSASYTYPVYIESTDAFGMVFYSNFPVLVERLLIDQSQAGQSTNSLLASFKQMKLKTPARLGDMLTLTCDENGKVSCRNQDEKEIFTVTRALLGAAAQTQTDSSSFIGQHKSIFPLWPDEHRGNLCLPTRTIFNLFERGRTNIFGGPTILSSAQSSNNHVYVARIQQYQHYALDLQESVMGQLSARIISDTEGKGDSIVDFNQRIECNGVEIASAKITCVSVDALSGAPTPFTADLVNVLFR